MQSTDRELGSLDYQLDYEHDFVVVLRRYLTIADDAPWGVHVVTINIKPDAWRRPFHQAMANRALGRFSTADVLAQAAHNGLVRSPYLTSRLGPDSPELDASILALDEMVRRYIWTQVVPMEWIDRIGLYGDRVAYLSREVGETPIAGQSFADFVADWDHR